MIVNIVHCMHKLYTYIILLVGLGCQKWMWVGGGWTGYYPVRPTYREREREMSIVYQL